MTLNIFKTTDEFITVDEAILRTRNSCQNFFSYFHVFEEDFGFTRLGFYWGMKKISHRHTIFMLNDNHPKIRTIIHRNLIDCFWCIKLKRIISMNKKL